MDKNKKILIWAIVISFIIIGAIITYAIFFEKENYFDTSLKIESTNRVINRGSISYADTIVYIGLDYFDIDSNIVYVFDLETSQFDKETGGDVKGFTLYISDHVHQIYVDPEMSRNQTIKWLAHELVHVHQQSRGDLRVQGDFLYFRNEIVDPVGIDYYQRPWEIEAYLKQDSVSNYIKKRVW